jgi:type 1 glutamine amidotransferase
MRSSNRYHQIPLIFLAVFALACSPQNSSRVELAASIQPEVLPSLKDKNILIVYGGWPGHKPELFAEKANKLLAAQGANVTVSESLDIYTDATTMSNVDLIVQSFTMDKIGNEQMKGLANAVKKGTGFAGAHGGICDSFRNNTEYQYMTGAQFVAHPGGQLKYRVNIKGDNPITSGVKDFTTTTEQYYLHVDPNIEVLATTTFDGATDEWIDGVVMPVVWTKTFGKGKIFCIALGHNPDEFDQPEAQEILVNGFKWASR